MSRPLPSSTPTLRPLTAYMHLWSLVNLLRISVAFNAGTGLVGSTLDKGALVLPLLILLAGCFPQRFSGVLPFAALLMRALTNLIKGSLMSNSQLWATQMDAAVLIAMTSCILRAKLSKLGSAILQPLTPEEEFAVVGSCAKTIRWQLSIFYFASGFWKVNTSFMNVSYSCASLFTVQPLEYLPDAILFASDGFFSTAVPLLARFIALIGPAATLFIESVVPALHLLDPKRYPVSAVLGVASTLAFHLVIGLTPPPSNVSSFGVTTCLRLFFMLPGATAQAVAELKSATSSGLVLGAAMVAAASAALALVAPFHAAAVSTVQGEGVDWHLAGYACMCVLLGRACFLELSASTRERAAASKSKALPRSRRDCILEGRIYTRMIGVSLVYAFVLPVLGLQEKAGACARVFRAAKADRGEASSEVPPYHARTCAFLLDLTFPLPPPPASCLLPPLSLSSCTRNASRRLPHVFSTAPPRRKQPLPPAHVAPPASARECAAGQRLQRRRGAC
jgi:hypothetical protein